MYRVGVDIGGTFTDFALFDARGAKMSVHKRLTTPHDPSEAVIEGIDALLKRDRRRHRRRERRRARHHARHQRGDRAPRRRHGHAGDGGLQRHPRYGLRAALRPVRPARQVSAAAGAAPAAHRGGRARALRRQRRDPARRSRGAGRRAARSRSSASRRSPSASCMPTPIRRTRRARPRSCARPLRTCSCPPRPTCSRTCASSSAGRRPPSTPSPSRCSTAICERLEDGPGVAGLPRPALHHGLQRRHADGRDRAALPGARARVGAGRGRADERLSRPQPRVCPTCSPSTWAAPRPRARWCAAARRSSATPWKWRACTSSARAAACRCASPSST